MKRFVVVLLCISVLLALGSKLEWDRDNYSGIRLQGPSFVAQAATAQAQEKGVNFLQQEAGISAYVKVGQAIDLAQVKGAFKTVETISDEYIIGEVALPDLPEKAHPHVYVNKDGWIVAYYTKSEPTSKIVYWGRSIAETTLQGAILRVFSPVEIEEIKYYHFKYPNAKRIMIITEVVEDKRDYDYFYLTIPKDLRIYEASWSLLAGRGYDGELWIDDAKLGEVKTGVHYGDLTNRLRADFRHIITVGWKDEGAAIVLIYEE